MSTDAWRARPRCDRTPAWAWLQALRGPFVAGFDLRAAFAADPARFEALAFEAPHLLADLSKAHWNAEIRSALNALAVETGVEAWRDAQLAGEPVNTTEGRAALHSALRAPRDPALPAPHADEVHAVLDALLAYAEAVRARAQSGQIDDVVHIGIGGSDLGPRLAVQALRGHAQGGPRLHFVSNVDAHEITALLPGLQARRTLFIVASKTFTTQETMANAQVARAWFLQNGGDESALAQHFVGLTTNLEAAAAFGIRHCFGFWDWVGGRYSLWSAIGLPIAIAIGAEGFRAMLAGAHAMDRHWAETPIARNLPIQLALLALWERNFLGFASRCVLPYHQDLARLPAHLQQLEMESLGKRVDLAGEPLPGESVAVTWGEPGSNSQHSFFQALHQGTTVVPIEFILVRQPTHTEPAMHAMLLANGLAQSRALMMGKSEAEARTEKASTAAVDIDAGVLARHRTFTGNRPSTTLLLERLDPASFGALVALYEHRVSTLGALWGINPFDQWGVELGKQMCNDLLPRLQSGDTGGLDGSTAGLLARLRGA
ncbi:glucose-6-phosphate isomerase [Rivibacter subsaxonicus]|uniref:Glucose-6-phosphate isomerase n=1 Tax=Rivibacter subsaxonicus TaxID=457575 RepID=A0A4Q7VGH2_9BURK|nr:glucose-6-phosphate isomerase [Rivibacter subsaxonicus]RZT95131.1 glucose-6-phosphate isomerase [Rivibacter subsaxonicus]